MTKNSTDSWRGYTLDELRYRRAATAAQTQVSRMMLTRQADTLRSGNPITRSWQSARNLLSAIGYVNSALIAFRILRSLRAVFRTARRR